MKSKLALIAGVAALCMAAAAPVYAQTADAPASNPSTSTGSDNGGKSSGGGAPLAGTTYDETNVTPEMPMGTMDMTKASSFTPEQKMEATGRCKVVANNPSRYKADVVAFCKGMM